MPLWQVWTKKCLFCALCFPSFLIWNWWLDSPQANFLAFPGVLAGKAKLSLHHIESVHDFNGYCHIQNDAQTMVSVFTKNHTDCYLILFNCSYHAAESLHHCLPFERLPVHLWGFRWTRRPKVATLIFNKWNYNHQCPLRSINYVCLFINL